jgi:TMEM175 potassium channel family protein
MSSEGAGAGDGTGTAAGQWIIAKSRFVESASARASASIAPALIAASAMALAFVIAITVPSIGIWSLLVLIPAGVLEGRFAQRHRKQPA